MRAVGSGKNPEVSSRVELKHADVTDKVLPAFSAVIRVPDL